MFGALRVAGLLPQLSAYDFVAITLIVLRGLVGAWQFVSGWLLADRRPQGLAMAPWALLTSAALMVFEVGFNLAPTDIYYWLRWQVTGGYAVYAIAAAVSLRRRAER
jgi:hypothetical protein